MQRKLASNYQLRTRPKPLRTITANSSPILLHIEMARDRAEIEERREGCSYEEALLLEWMEAYFRERKA